MVKDLPRLSSTFVDLRRRSDRQRGAECRKREAIGDEWQGPHLPPRLSEGLDAQPAVRRGTEAGRRAWEAFPRPQADGRTQHDPRRGSSVDREACYRPPLGLDVPAVRHRVDGRQARGDPEGARLRGDARGRGRERDPVSVPICQRYGHTGRKRAHFRRKLAGRQGLDPRFTGPEPVVLPLNDLPVVRPPWPRLRRALGSAIIREASRLVKSVEFRATPKSRSSAISLLAPRENERASD